VGVVVVVVVLMLQLLGMLNEGVGGGRVG